MLQRLRRSVYSRSARDKKLLPQAPPREVVSGKKPSRDITAEETEELRALVRHHISFLPPSYAPEVTVSAGCFLFMPGEVSNKKNPKFLDVLRLRKRQYAIARQIALELGWSDCSDPYGAAMREPWPRRVAHMQMAEEHGCMVSMLSVKTLQSSWIAPAAWLARVWDQHGRPVIQKEMWDRALTHSLCDVDLLQ
jgi:hypothetical protein